MEGLIFGILWYVLSLNFKNLLFRILRKKPCRAVSVYYCIWAFLCRCRCRSFNSSLCHLSPFLLSYVTVSRPCRLLEFTLTRPYSSHLGFKCTKSSVGMSIKSS